MDRWICVFGMPFTILTDNGSAFTSKFFGVITQVLGVKHVFATAYRPTTNGQVERWNASLVDLVSHLGTEKEWDLHIGLACTAYNSTVHSSTVFAPLELATTREPCPAVWTRVPTLRPPGKTTKSHLRHQLLLRAEKLCRTARETMDSKLARYKNVYDQHVRRRHRELMLGDSVLVRTFVTEPGRSTKLSAPVAGPYTVVGMSDSNVKIRTREGVQTLHLDRVIRCPTDLPSGVVWSSKPEKSKQKSPPHEKDDFAWLLSLSIGCPSNIFLRGRFESKPTK